MKELIVSCNPLFSENRFHTSILFWILQVLATGKMRVALNSRSRTRVLWKFWGNFLALYSRSCCGIGRIVSPDYGKLYALRLLISLHIRLFILRLFQEKFWEFLIHSFSHVNKLQNSSLHSHLRWKFLLIRVVASCKRLW